VEDLGTVLGAIELANFSKFPTMFLEVFSNAVATLSANSAPGIEGGFLDLAGTSMLGSYVGFG
jgi:hypothetical protein